MSTAASRDVTRFSSCAINGLFDGGHDEPHQWRGPSSAVHNGSKTDGGFGWKTDIANGGAFVAEWAPRQIESFARWPLILRSSTALKDNGLCVGKGAGPGQRNVLHARTVMLARERHEPFHSARVKLPVKLED